MAHYSPLQSEQSTHHEQPSELKNPSLQHAQTHTNDSHSAPVVCTSPLDKLKIIKQKASEPDRNQDKKSNEEQPSHPRQIDRRDEHSRGRLSRSRDKKKHRRQPKKLKKDSDNHNPAQQTSKQTNEQELQAKKVQKQKQYQLLVNELLGDSKQLEQTNALQPSQDKKSICTPMIIPRNQSWDDVPKESEGHNLDRVDQASPEQTPQGASIYNPKQPGRPLDIKQQMNNLLSKTQSVPGQNGIQSLCNQNQPTFSTYPSLADGYAHYPPYYFQEVPNITHKQMSFQDKSQRYSRPNQQPPLANPSGQYPRSNKTKFLLTEREKYYKTRLCFDFKMGRCSKSKEDCNFAHGEDDIRPPKSNNLCRNFQRGYCKKTQTECKFVHTLANPQDGPPKQAVQEEIAGLQGRRVFESVKDDSIKNESDKMNSAYLPSHSRLSPQQYFTSQDNPRYYGGNNIQFHNYAQNSQFQPAYHYKNYPFLQPYYHSAYNQRYQQQSFPQYYSYQMQYPPQSSFQNNTEYQEEIRTNSHIDSIQKHLQYPYLGSPINSNFNMKPGYCDERLKKNSNYPFQSSEVVQESRLNSRKQ